MPSSARASPSSYTLQIFRFEPLAFAVPAPIIMIISYLYQVEYDFRAGSSFDWVHGAPLQLRQLLVARVG
jgi:hypothetical protein